MLDLTANELALAVLGVAIVCLSYFWLYAELGWSESEAVVRSQRGEIESLLTTIDAINEARAEEQKHLVAIGMAAGRVAEAEERPPENVVHLGARLSLTEPPSAA